MTGLLRFALASFALGAGASSLVPGCTSDDCEAKGGITVEVEGGTVCEGKCDPESCVTNNTCVGNRCVLVCTSHADCFSKLDGDSFTQGCYPVQADSASGLNDGETVFACVPSTKIEDAGRACQDAEACAAFSACPDGTPCAAGGCPVEHCKPLACQEQGDESFCTTVDCGSDADCAPGFACGVVESPNKICGTTKGQEEPCVDPANNAATGATYVEGPRSLLRSACVKRELCSPCSSNVDCADVEMTCVGVGDGTFCAKTCAGDVDCPADFRCSEEALCVPRSGVCQPPANDNFCFNCIDDLDCGPGGPDSTIGCLELHDGQRGCFDFSFPDACTTDEDCPTAPSGRHGECLDEDDGIPDTDPLYKKCFAPFDSTVLDFQCWPTAT
jgi:hypothetical protein